MDEGRLSVEDFPPEVLRQYAVLADGERGVVVGPRGDYCWMCLPRWHNGAVFNSLLGGPGVYAVSPDERRFVWGGFYEPRSLIWVSRWVTGRGIVECREALALPPHAHRAVLLRRIRAVDGQARMRITLDVRADYGNHTMSSLSYGDDQGRPVWTGRSGPARFRWTGAGDAELGEDGSLHAVLNVDPGRHHDLVLELSDHEIGGELIRAEDAWRATERGWAQAVPVLGDSLADFDAQVAYAVLRGLTNSDGGMVAAVTSSLPERADQDRNYDYRYCWIRDQCYAGQAVAAAGGFPLLDDTVRFVSECVLADGAALRPAYSVDGSPPPGERNLNLPGYPGGLAKAGNRVADQFQLDIHGEALLLFAAAARLDRLDSTHWQVIQTLVRTIEQRWQQPDAGIWELDNRRWAHSRLTCASGLRSIAAVAPSRWGATWQRLADRVITDAGSDCLHPSGRWQRSPADSRIDAALLLPAIRGGIPANDPRTAATIEAVRSQLSEQGFVYRFRPDQRPLGESEGAFLLCGFVMALAEHQQGNDLAAVRWFERNRTACGPPGLLAEEYDVGQHQLRGNLPQAFVHALLLETAHRLAGTSPAGAADS
jgi:GH15 family glucan-1,4-alpha-glucosidase